MVTLVNRAKVNTSTTGTGTISLGPVVAGYQTFSAAGVADGNVIRYVIEDGAEWEIGTGTYAATGSTLTRTVSESSNAGAAIPLTGNATVFVGLAASDIVQTSDIGVNVQAYDANIVSDGAYVHTDNNYTTAEKSKLAGVEAGATADQTAAEILTAIKTVDGTASGLDADLLDGQHGSYYYSPANAPDPTLTLTGDVTGTATFTNLGNATLTAVVADDSHNHIIGNVDGLQTALDGKAPTSHTHTGVYEPADATILKDADIGVTVQGYSAALAGTTASYTTAEKTKLAGIETGATADQTAAEILTAIKTVDGAASGLDADLLDGLHASSFLQANQTITLSGDATGSGTTSIVVTVADDSHTHDGRYYTEAESDSRFVNASGDTMTGTLNYRMLVSQTTANYDTAGDASGFSTFYGTPSAVGKPSGTDHAVTTLSFSNAWQVQDAGDWRTNARYIRSQASGAWGTWERVFADGYHPNADTLTTARTIALAGDVTGSANFNGSSNISITATVADDSHNHTIANVDGLQTALNGKMQDGGSYGTLYLSNWFRSTGNSGWYNQSYGGGINMQDTTWVRVYGSKSFLVSGTCQATDFNTTSDISLKDNVTDIDGALDKVCNLRGVEFDWKATGVHAVGFIAQEVEAIVPELVDTNEEDGIKSVKYGNVTALLVEAVKELRLEIAELKQQLANHA